MRRAVCILAVPVLLAACVAAPPPLPVVITMPPAVPRAAAAPPSARPALAPGAVDPDVAQWNIASTICMPGWTRRIRPPASYTDRLKREQMPLYGYAPGTDPRSVKEDHREPLEIGGAPRDPRNLWPEPRAQARAKDRLESAVKRDVCAGRLTLQQGQAIFFGDFWNDYQLRFGAR